MSVLKSDRTESRWEPIIYAEELHSLLINLMRRSFGVKDLDHLVRTKYAYGDIDKEDFSYFRMEMHNYKVKIDRIASLLTNNLRAANSIRPKTFHEYEQRRDYLNDAIANCAQITKELQKVVEIFDVDINIYARYDTAINREIDLIKRWRLRDEHQIKPRLKS